MAWKKDDKGQLAADESGNPVWVSETTGEDIGVDYAAVSKKLREANQESKTRKDKIRQLEGRLAAFEGIEDLEAWRREADEALEFRKNAPDRDKEIKSQIDAQVEARTASLKSQLADRDGKLAEKDKAIAEITARMNGMIVRSDVLSSKLLNGRIREDARTFIEREMTRAGGVDENGKAYYRYDDGETIFGDNGNASIDEAIPLFLKKLGYDPAKFIMSQDDSKGSNGKPNPGTPYGPRKNPWKKEHLNITEQCKIMQSDPALARQLMAQAGAQA